MYMWVYLHTHICGLLFNVIGRCQLHQLSKYKRVHLVINGPFYVSLIANYYSELLICGVINEILTLCHRLRWNSRNGYTIDSLKNIALCIFDIIKITLFFVGFFLVSALQVYRGREYTILMFIKNYVRIQYIQYFQH